MQLEAVAVGGAQGLQLGGEDHRLGVAVGVEHPYPSIGGGEHRLGDREHRCDTAAPAEPHHWARGIVRHEGAARLHHVEHVALADMVVEPVRHLAARHPLDRDGEVGVGGRSAGHGVAAGHLLALDEGAEHTELPRQIAEQIGEVDRHLQHERAGVGGLLHDPRLQPIEVGATELLARRRVQVLEQVLAQPPDRALDDADDVAPQRQRGEAAGQADADDRRAERRELADAAGRDRMVEGPADQPHHRQQQQRHQRSPERIAEQRLAVRMVVAQEQRPRPRVDEAIAARDAPQQAGDPPGR